MKEEGGEGNEQQKELMLAQSKLLELANEHRRIINSIEGKVHEERMAKLTFRELEGLPSETRIFKTLGRAFVVSEMEQVKDRLKMVEGNAGEEKVKLAQKIKLTEESLKKAEQKFEQLVASANK